MTWLQLCRTHEIGRSTLYSPIIVDGTKIALKDLLEIVTESLVLA